MYKRPLRAPTKENALVLIAVDMEARIHRSRSRLESELPGLWTTGPDISTVLKGILGR